MGKPTFIIGGERRSGSTTLYESLKTHPEIDMLPQSDYDFFIEPELFAKTPPENTELNRWEATNDIFNYEKLFDNLQDVCGQKDADLLWWKPSHKRLASHLPDTKFIFILRDPVKRAESQYFNELRKGRETLTFKEALLREEKGTLNSWEKLHLQYKARGCYVKSLEHFFKYINRDRVRVIILEELFLDWEMTMGQLADFLGVDGTHFLKLKPVHSNKKVNLVRRDFSNKPAVKWFFDLWDRATEACIVRTNKTTDSRMKWRKRLRGAYYKSRPADLETNRQIYEELQRYYRPYNKRLEELLGIKLKHW